MFGIAFDENLVERIAEYCDRHGIDRVEFLRRAAELKLSKKCAANKKST